MSEFVAITYIGATPGFVAKCGSRIYDFEWRKSLGIGKSSDEVRLSDAKALARYRDRRGKKMFLLEKPMI